MAKHKGKPKEKGVLLIPFEPFYKNSLQIGTKCDIVSEDNDKYTVDFPVFGYAGTMSIKKRFIKKGEKT